MPESRELTRSECEELLRSGVVGRVAFSAPDGPHIVPVNYSVVDDAVLIRLSAYSLVATHGRDAPLAFEIDQFDHEYQRGWSVLVRGRSQVVEPDELDELEEASTPRPWAAGVRQLLLRLPCRDLTGRQLGSGWDPLAGLSVRRAP